MRFDELPAVARLRRVPRGGMGRAVAFACIALAVTAAAEVLDETELAVSGEAVALPPVQDVIGSSAAASANSAAHVANDADSQGPVEESEVDQKLERGRQMWDEVLQAHNTLRQSAVAGEDVRGRAERVRQLYEELADAGAGNYSAAAQETLALMYEWGWDGVHDLRTFDPPDDAPLLTHTHTHTQTAAFVPGWLARWVVRFARSLPPYLGGPLSALVSSSTSPASSASLVVPADVRVGVQMHTRAAEGGNASAQFTMAVLHATGLFGVPTDAARAALYLHFAAEGGSEDAILARAHALTHTHTLAAGAASTACELAAGHYEHAARRAVELVDRSHDLLQAFPLPGRVMLDEDALEDVHVRHLTGERDTNFLAMLHMAADRGDRSAHVALGHVYLLGARGNEPDYVRASEHLHVAAEEGDSLSKLVLSLMYLHGLGVRADPELALSLAQNAANEGNAPGKNALGRMYMTGLPGVLDPDPSKAWELFNAASSGSSDAHYNLALMLLDGTAPEGRNFPKAFAHLQQAATQGHVKSLYRIGLMQSRGIGAGKDCAAALRAFRAAVHRVSVHGHVDNAHNLLAVGNVPAAVMEYARAAHTGVEIGLWNAAILLERRGSVQGMLDDASVETPIPRQPAGTPGFLYELARWLFPASGDAGSALNLRRALRLRLRSSSNGWSELAVGDAFFHGLAGLNVSWEDAAARYQVACNQRIPEGCFNMGYMHEYGLGVQKDTHLAKRFYDLCLEHQKASRESAPAPVHLAFTRMYLASSWDWFFRHFGQPITARLGGVPLTQAVFRSVAHLLSAAPPRATASQPPAPQSTSTGADAAASATPSAGASPSGQAAASVSTSSSPSPATSQAAAAASSTVFHTPNPSKRMMDAFKRNREQLKQRLYDESLPTAVLSLLYQVLSSAYGLLEVFMTASHGLLRAVAGLMGVHIDPRLRREDSAFICACMLFALAVYVRRRRRPAVPEPLPAAQAPPPPPMLAPAAA